MEIDDPEVQREQDQLDAEVLADWQRQLDEADGNGMPPPPAALQSTEPASGEDQSPHAQLWPDSGLHTETQPVLQASSSPSQTTGYQPAPHITSPQETPDAAPAETLRENIFQQTVMPSIIHDVSMLQDRRASASQQPLLNFEPMQASIYNSNNFSTTGLAAIEDTIGNGARLSSILPNGGRHSYAHRSFGSYNPAALTELHRI